MNSTLSLACSPFFEIAGEGTERSQWPLFNYIKPRLVVTSARSCERIFTPVGDCVNRFSLHHVTHWNSPKVLCTLLRRLSQTRRKCGILASSLFSKEVTKIWKLKLVNITRTLYYQTIARDPSVINLHGHFSTTVSFQLWTFNAFWISWISVQYVSRESHKKTLNLCCKIYRV